jgi:hypothetical protein
VYACIYIPYALILGYCNKLILQVILDKNSMKNKGFECKNCKFSFISGNLRIQIYKPPARPTLSCDSTSLKIRKKRMFHVETCGIHSSEPQKKLRNYEETITSTNKKV